MSLLGAHWRIQVLNATTQTVAANAVVVRVKRLKRDSTGVNVFEGLPDTVFNNGSTISNNAFSNGSTIDNTGGSASWDGATFEIAVTSPASSNGPVTVYLQRSVDGGTTWGTNGTARTILTQINFTTATTVTNVVHLI